MQTSTTRSRSYIVSTQDNKQAVQRFIEEVFNKGNLEGISQYLDPSFSDKSQSAFIDYGSNQAGARQAISSLRAAFPDLNITVNQIIAEDDKVACNYDASGTMRAALRSQTATFTPSNQQYRWKGSMTVEMANGKIKAIVANSSSLPQQLLSEKDDSKARERSASGQQSGGTSGRSNQ